MSSWFYLHIQTQLSASRLITYIKPWLKRAVLAPFFYLMRHQDPSGLLENTNLVESRW